jgi:ATP-binding cassette subfamily B protein
MSTNLDNDLDGGLEAGGEQGQVQRTGFRFGWQVGTFRRRLWAWSWLWWTGFYMMPLLSGYLMKVAFDRLERSESVTAVLLAAGGAEVVRWIMFGAAIWVVVRWWITGMTMLRTNMLHAQTVSGGERAARLPHSPAESIARFQDDTRDALLWSDSWLDATGTLAFAAVALVVIAAVEPWAAAVVVIPIVLVTAITRFLTPRLYSARAADRAAASGVTSFLGEAFSGVQAIRLAGKEAPVVARLETYTSTRRRTAVRDTVLSQAVDGLSSSTADLMIGLTLLVLAPGVRSGSLGIGDVALIVVYATQLGEAPRQIARLITSREQAFVSFGRMQALVASGRPDDLLTHRAVTIDRHDEMLVRDPDPERTPLSELRVRGLSAVYPSTGGGDHDIDLDVPRGDFVVVTGPVGAGKTTLLRAIVGLEPTTAGTVEWNGEPIADPGAWFVPPNSAFVGQVPNLFSESIAANVALGRSIDDLDEVLALAALAQDVEGMPDGAGTTIGARGLRLSGGQAQRVATARSLATRPELLVVDDLSSALDVRTERELWDRLAALTDTTVIAVSHRQLAFERADQIVRLQAGRRV